MRIGLSPPTAELTSIGGCELNSANIPADKVSCVGGSVEAVFSIFIFRNQMDSVISVICISTKLT